MGGVNFYIQNYLPLLNSVFSSSSCELPIRQTLFSKLEELRNSSGQNNKRWGPASGRPPYVYDINERGINPQFTLFNNSKEVNVALGFPRTSLLRYKNTSIPYRGKLLFSKKIANLNKVFEESQKNTPKRQVNRRISIKV